MDNVVALRTTQAALNEAWQRYDEAQRRALGLYQDPASTSAERRNAVLEAHRLHREFCDLFDRTGAK